MQKYFSLLTQRVGEYNTEVKNVWGRVVCRDAEQALLAGINTLWRQYVADTFIYLYSTNQDTEKEKKGVPRCGFQNQFAMGNMGLVFPWLIPFSSHRMPKYFGSIQPALSFTFRKNLTSYLTRKQIS